MSPSTYARYLTALREALAFHQAAKDPANKEDAVELEESAYAWLLEARDIVEGEE